MLEDVTPSSLRRLRRWAPWIVIFGLAAGPAAGMWALAWRIDDIPPELRVTPVPVFTGPTLRIRDGRTNVVAKLEIGDGPALIAPEWSGVVTSVEVSSGDAIATGDPLLSVDRVTRVAVASDMPFHRELGNGSRGRDVEALERLLVALGLFDEEPDEIFTRTTAMAVRAFESTLGVDPPTGVFSPSLVMWMPTEPLVVGEVLVSVGSPVPGAGSAIVRAVPRVISAELVTGEGAPVSFEGDRVLEVEGREVAIISGGSAITDEVAEAIWDSRTPLGSDVAGGAVMIPATLRLPEPVEVWAVASSAVMVDMEGAFSCVWVEDGDALIPIDVTPVGGTLGVTDLRGPLAGLRVLVNPLEILPDPACP